MKKQLLFTSILTLCIVLIGKAQTEKELIGKWQFDAIVSEAVDEKKVQILQSIFKAFKLEFKEDGSYAAGPMGEEEKGTWTMDGLVINQTSASGKTSSMKLNSLTEQEMLLDFGSKDGDLIKIIKVDQFKITSKEEPVKLERVAAKPEQIHGTWYFKEKDMTGKSSEEILAETLLKSMLEKAYFTYRPDGSYEDDVLFNTVITGKWELTNDNTILVVTKSNKPVKYDIVKITENEMGLVNHEVTGILTFVRTKTEK